MVHVDLTIRCHRTRYGRGPWAWPLAGQVIVMPCTDAHRMPLILTRHSAIRRRWLTICFVALAIVTPAMSPPPRSGCCCGRGVWPPGSSCAVQIPIASLPRTPPVRRRSLTRCFGSWRSSSSRCCAYLAMAVGVGRGSLAAQVIVNANVPVPIAEADRGASSVANRCTDQLQPRQGVRRAQHIPSNNAAAHFQHGPGRMRRARRLE
jgi:hypothetical protein